MAIIKTENLTKKYKEELALNNISITVEKGQIYGLVGRNGAGKTTLLRVLCGLIFQNGGRYLINEVYDNHQSITKQRQKMAAIIEVPALYKQMTAYQNLKIHATICGIKQMNSKIAEVLELVDLSQTRTKKVKNFSLGMKQRLAIAMALLNEPEILILDEPMNGLDPAAIKQLRELMLLLNQEKKITIVISSHILDELAKVASKYAFIDKGVLLEEITSKELNQKATCYVQAKVKKIDDLENIFKRNPTIEKYQINEDRTVRIYGTTDIGSIANLLVLNGYEIENIYNHDFKIEDYFINLIGEHK